MQCSLNIVHVLAAVCLVILYTHTCITERVSYISTEHPKVTYYNQKFTKYANLTSRRFGRHDRFYYVDMHIETLVVFDNNLKADVYFYEFLSNMYKPTFVEMHFGICDLILKDKFFGTALKREIKTCPVPVGAYHLLNMSIPLEHIPAGFPFTKGRIYANFTYAPTKEFAGSGYIDMEVKQYNVKKQKGDRKRS